MAEVAIGPAKPEDLDAVLVLLAAAGLPVSGVPDQFPDAYVCARAGGTLVAAAGLEVHGHDGLLRSVVVAEAHRSTGLGRRLVDERLEAARGRGLGAVYLLTTTAPEYFARFGFEPATRDQAPEALGRSTEFATVCPASAQCLRHLLERV